MKPLEMLEELQRLGCACRSGYPPCLGHFGLMDDDDKHELRVQLGVTTPVVNRRGHEIKVNPKGKRRFQDTDLSTYRP